MSDYSFSAGGSLKLKGGVTEGGIVKKSVLFHKMIFNLVQQQTEMIARKKKKSKSKGTNVDVELDREREQVKKVLSGEDEPRKSKSGSPSTSSRNSPGAGTNGTRKTEAEKRFEQVQKRRVS